MQEGLDLVQGDLEARPVGGLDVGAEVDPRNTASLRLLTRLGFVETGRAERTMQWRDEWCDSIYLRRDY